MLVDETFVEETLNAARYPVARIFVEDTEPRVDCPETLSVPADCKPVEAVRVAPDAFVKLSVGNKP